MQFAGEDQPDRIIPAYAGSTGLLGYPIRIRSDHPRIRGEHDHEAAEGVHEVGSSPHTRGAPDARRRRHPLRRIIPAYAGSTFYSGWWTGSDAGSSPHTRGARPGGRCRFLGGGIIPAYAGSTCKAPRSPR